MCNLDKIMNDHFFDGQTWEEKYGSEGKDRNKEDEELTEEELAEEEMKDLEFGDTDL